MGTTARTEPRRPHHLVGSGGGVPTDLPYLALHGRDPGPEYRQWLHQTILASVIEVRDIATHYVHLADPAWFVSRLLSFTTTEKPSRR